MKSLSLQSHFNNDIIILEFYGNPEFYSFEILNAFIKFMRRGIERYDGKPDIRILFIFNFFPKAEFPNIEGTAIPKAKIPDV